MVTVCPLPGIVLLNLLFVYSVFAGGGVKIGDKIKKLRLSHSLTQEELAGRSDLTKGFISQLERDQASPSIATLKDILDVFSVSLGEFFQESGDVEKVVYARGDRKDIYDEHAGIELLIPAAHDNRFDVALVTLETGQYIADSGHAGEEFGFLLQGKVEIILEHAGTHQAQKGECFFYQASQGHRISNRGERPAKFLWVVAPSTFF